MNNKSTFKTGTEAIVSMPRRSNQNYLARLDEQGLRYWASIGYANVVEAVLLHSWVDPMRLRIDCYPPHETFNKLVERVQVNQSQGPFESAVAALYQNIQTATDAVRNGQLSDSPNRQHPQLSQVRLVDFNDWAMEAGLPVVSGWGSDSIHEDRDSKWPWGDAETPELVALADAMRAYWIPVSDGGTYDPRDPSIKSTSECIVKWIRDKHALNGVSLTSARRIDALIRPLVIRKGGRTGND